jgi:hypothetical protein
MFMEDTTMSRDEILFFCELIKVEPDRQKKDLLLEEILNAIVQQEIVIQVGEMVATPRAA